MTEKKPSKLHGTTKDMVFCPFFKDFRSRSADILCETCEHGVMYEVKHFASHDKRAEFAHEVCYRSDYAKKCNHAAAMNRYYENREG